MDRDRARHRAAEHAGDHWQVDLETRVLTAYRLDGTAWRLIGTFSDEHEARIDPFDAVSLNLADWWPQQPR